MSSPGPKSLTSNIVPNKKVIRKAASLFNQGSSWAVIAEELGIDEELCRSWQHSFPEIWQEAVDEARDQSVRRLRFEALQRLESQLDDPNPKTRANASKILLEYSLKYEHQQARIAEMKRRNQERHDPTKKSTTSRGENELPEPLLSPGGSTNNHQSHQSHPRNSRSESPETSGETRG